MTVQKATATVLFATIAFAAIGATVGYLLGRFAPNYYRGVFTGGDSPTFDPVQVGFGQGLTQGITGGVVVGLLIVVIVTWQEVRTVRTGKEP